MKYLFKNKDIAKEKSLTYQNRDFRHIFNTDNPIANVWTKIIDA